EKTINRLENAINHTKGEAKQKMVNKINKYGGFLLGEKTINSMVNGYMNYVTMCPTLLRQLIEESKKSEFVAVKEALFEVEKFLNQKDRTHLAPNAILEHFFDDAYVINNTIQILLDAGLVKKEQFTYDTTAVQVVNTYVSFAINNAEKTRLDAVLQQIKQMVGIKKDEINWGKVAAIGVGALAVLGGIAALTGDGGGDVADTGGPDNSGGGSFEDNMANFNARHGGGLSDNFYR
ncbi:MAG TPA: hypothetical protein VK907_08740, partial [Phnomibacter sp.]|nr:hypothetical protein [Phnomibacter sp.]